MFENETGRHRDTEKDRGTEGDGGRAPRVQEQEPGDKPERDSEATSAPCPGLTQAGGLAPPQCFLSTYYVQASSRPPELTPSISVRGCEGN